jgi:hypothetical protein
MHSTQLPLVVDRQLYRSHNALTSMRIITGAPLALNICSCDLSTVRCPVRLAFGSWIYILGESHEHIRRKLLIIDLDLKWRLVRSALLLLGRPYRSYCHRVRWTESVDHRKSPFCVAENPRHYLPCYHDLCTNLRVDTLCINQSSMPDALHERRHQVQIVARIFGSARTVIGDIGERPKYLTKC